MKREHLFNENKQKDNYLYNYTDSDTEEVVTKLSLTGIRKKEIFLRLRINIGVSIVVTWVALLQIVIALIKGNEFGYKYHDYYLLLLISTISIILAMKRKLVFAGWATTLAFIYSNLMGVIIRENLIQSILFNSCNIIYIYIYSYNNFPNILQF